MNLDKTFRHKIQEFKGIPISSKWDKENNWEMLNGLREKQNKYRLRNRLAIAASIALMISITFFYQLNLKTNAKADNVKREYLKQYEDFLSNNFNSAYIVDYPYEISLKYKRVKELDDVIILYNNY